jgi:hypothetical protein
MKIAVVVTSGCAVRTKELCLRIRRRDKRKIRGSRKAVHERVNRVSRLRIDFFDWAVIEKCVGDNL